MFGWFTRLCDKVVRSRAVRGTRWLVRSWWDDLDAEPYVVEIGIPTTFDLSALKIQEIRGLLAAYTVITSPGDQKLISHWKSAAAYKALQPTFFAKLGIPAGSTPMAEGYQQQAIAQPPKLGWLWRHGGLVIGILGGLAAVVGNVEKIRDPVLALVVRPKVQITAARETLDVLTGEEFDAEFTVRNISDWVSCDITFQPSGAQPPDTVALDTTVPGPFIGLKPGGTEVVKIHGVAKSAAPGGVVQTQVSFAGKAETWVGWKQDLAASNTSGQQFHLMVWPRRTVGVKQVGDSQQGKRCRIDCQFMIGDEFAKGFEVQALLRDPDDVRFDRIQFPGSPQLDRLPETQPPHLIEVRWLAKDIKPRKRYQFSLYAKSQQDRTEEQWRAVVQRVKINFGSLPAGK